MRLLRAAVDNFGSYKHLEFDFIDAGLTLVYGPTGSGKSSLCDIAPWILYGRTAKDGNVDDVRSWFAGGETTTGTIWIEAGDNSVVTITRIRGKAGQNDLFWTEQNEAGIPFDDGQEEPPEHRGKDLSDTQRLLDKRLGVGGDLYLSAAYFNDFSPAGNFFTAKAKSRKEVFEKIADLSFALRLSEASSEARKSAKKDLAQAELEKAAAVASCVQLCRAMDDTTARKAKWDTERASTEAALRSYSESFESTKKEKVKAIQKELNNWNKQHNEAMDKYILEIEARDVMTQPEEFFTKEIKKLQSTIAVLRSEKCSLCGGPKNDKEVEKARKDLADWEKAYKENTARISIAQSYRQALKNEAGKVNPYMAMIEAEQSKVNTYSDQLAASEARINPFIAQLKQLQEDYRITDIDAKVSDQRVRNATSRISSLTQLYDLAAALRGTLLSRAVAEIQAKVNETLTKYFDAEIRVSFEVNGDDLDVGITKNGYACVFTQLSKGQRQLLKLSFVTAIMAASANRSGVHFSQLFMDESLDGLDAALKVKAFALFQDLSAGVESLYLVEHAPEFQAMFSNKIHVTLNEDHSELEYE